MNEWDGDKWLSEIMPSIANVQTMMAERLSDNPAKLYDQLSKAESWLARVNTMSADANARLDHAEYQAMMSLTGSHTVDEKRVMIRESVVSDRRMRDILEGLAKALQNRIMLGCNLRRQNAGERSGY